MLERIHLSPPHLSGREAAFLNEALASGWIAPVGPQLERFEQQFAATLGVEAALAVSSGTAALHLALEVAGVLPGDEVLCSTLTFCASANPILYLGGRPVLIDSEPDTWNLDLDRVADTLQDRARRGRLPRAIVAVDIFGQPVDIAALREIASPLGVWIIEDAAEALGGTRAGQPIGAAADASCFSFNGNKIITTSGGGMLCASRPEWIERARHLASQARDPAPHYQHSRVGYNYRLSNLLAAVGVAQLEKLADRVAARRANFSYYRQRLADLPGLSWMPSAPHSEPNRWLSVALIDPRAFGVDREAVRLALAAAEIEARPVWKPLHLQPAFAACEAVGGHVAQGLFEQGLCLPSGSNLTPEQLERVVGTIRACCPAASPLRRTRLAA